MSRRLTDEEQEQWHEETKHARRVRGVKPVPSPVKKTTPAPTTVTTAVPAVKKTAPSTALEMLDKRSAARRFKTHACIEARIDLHGKTQEEAHDALFGFIARAHTAGKRHVVIITGKGTRGEGVLKRAVPRWLELPALRRHVSAIAHASPEKGGDGVLHVFLKK